MTTKFHRFLALALLVALFPVSSLPAQSVALTPVEKKEKGWQDRHASMVAEMAKGYVDLLMIGDSITHGWEGADHKKVWDSYYGHRKALNLGIGGDRTEHVLWRLDHLPLEKINPKVAVLMIGTNNVGHKSSSPKDAAEGVKAIVDKLEKQYPEMKILVLNVFPRDEKPGGNLRKAVDEINSYLPELLKGKENVTLLDINSTFLDANGNLPKKVMPDGLHPNMYGYELWAKAMEPTLVKLLGEENIATIPVDKLREGWWRDRHAANVAKMSENKSGAGIELLLVGDSITHGWDSHQTILDKYFGKYRPINLGFGGDQTQHVLWRLDNLPLDKISPKVAMVMIGTNNFFMWENTPWMIADGIKAIVDKLQKQYPDIKVVVLEVFPRGEKPDDWGRYRVSQTNLALRDLLKDQKNVELIDIGDSFKNKNDILLKNLMPDFLHPNDKGYEIWGQKLAPVMKEKFGR